MRDFNLVDATSLEHACTLLADNSVGTRVYAGGTDILGVLKDRIHSTYPTVLVNLKTIPGLDRIEEDHRGLRVGALVTVEELERHDGVRERYPALAQAARAVAAPQLRAMGSVGGNLCQEPRCWYYRSPGNAFDCLRKGGRRCNAFTGESRFHSIRGATVVAPRPCTVACPGSVEIPLHLAELRRGDVDEAMRLLLSRNPMPSVTGRVCPHACEAECNRGLYDESVSIRAVERSLGDALLERNLLPEIAPASGRRVAVVGSGPAGLSAAFYSRCLGHAVTVFERAPELGGLLRYAIPQYRLPVRVLEGVLDSYRAMGVEFQTGVEIGLDRSLTSLRESYDVVFVGAGAGGERSLGIDGEGLLDSGLSFLRSVRVGEQPRVGRRVLVIGGGNVAIDVALAAKRSGAEDVSMACLEARDGMPAFSHEIERALEEGIHVVDSCGPVRVVTDSSGALTGVDLARCVCLLDDEGRFAPQLDECDVQRVDADQVFLAIGQTIDLGGVGAPELSAGSWMVGDPETGATPLAGVFAGGDAVSGPSSVIAAIGAGRRAAEAIDWFLRGGSLDGDPPLGPDRAPSSELRIFAADCLDHSRPVRPLDVPVAERRLEVEDAPVGLTAAQTAAEAGRCFDCGCVAASPSDLASPLVALGASVVTTRRVIPAEDFFAARPGASTVLEADELVTEIAVPAPQPGSVSVYLKFRLRGAIDFPILSVACGLILEEGVVRDPRVVLGAAAPVPLRLPVVEQYLDGQFLTAMVAAEAGRLALEGSLTLPANRYKARIAGELVRRALLQLWRRL